MPESTEAEVKLTDLSIASMDDLLAELHKRVGTVIILGEHPPSETGIAFSTWRGSGLAVLGMLKVAWLRWIAGFEYMANQEAQRRITPPNA